MEDKKNRWINRRFNEMRRMVQIQQDMISTLINVIDDMDERIAILEKGGKK
jgi:hypothetical protein